MKDHELVIAYIAAALLGLLVGGLLNILIRRLPRGVSPLKCPSCHARVRWYDAIPLFSYIILRGRCRSCGSRIPLRYPFIEAANCLLWVCSVAWFSPYGVGMTAVVCVALSALLALSVADLETMLLPDSLIITFALSGCAMLVIDVCGVGVGIGWVSRLIGMAAGFVFFGLLYFGCRLIFKREGLGFGDVKLMAAAGLVLGWKSLIFSVLLGSVSAALVLGGIRLCNPKGEKKEFAFAPFLAAAIAVSLFFGQTVMGWYFGLFLA